MSTILEKVEALEDRLRLAMLRGDVEVLDELIAPEILFTGPDGRVLDKEADLEVHRSGVLKLHQLEPRDRRIQPWDDYAVVSLEAELEGTFGGQAFAGRFRYLRVWMQRDNKWQIVAGGATPVVN